MEVSYYITSEFEKYREYYLSGDYKGFKECSFLYDCFLIYKMKKGFSFDIVKNRNTFGFVLEGDKKC